MGDQDNSNELRSSARYHTLTGFLLLLILLYNVPASFLWGEHFALFFFSFWGIQARKTNFGQLKEGDLKLHEFTRGSSASEDQWEQPEMRGVLWKLDAKGKERWRRNKAECYRNNKGMTHRRTNVSPLAREHNQFNKTILDSTRTMDRFKCQPVQDDPSGRKLPHQR